MSNELVESIDVSRHLMVVKFSRSVIPESLKEPDAVKLYYIDPATPLDITDHLRSISVENDYDSFRNILTLYFEDLPDNVGEYSLELTNIVTAAGRLEAQDSYLITYTWDNGNIEDPGERPEDPPPTIIDKSIPKNVPYSDRSGSGSGSDATLGNPVLVDVDYDNYEIVIDMGNPNYVSEAATLPDPSHFTLEKKKVSIDFEKWSEVTINSITDDDAGVVTIDTNEFDTQHKYRVRIHKDANDGTAAELLFLTDITPVIGDPEHVAIPLPVEVTEVEVIEAMFRASVWVLGALSMNITDDLPFVAYEYVATAAQCELSKTYGLQVKVAPNQTVRLGDLSVTSGNRSDAGTISRGTAADVCEMAYALRQEVIRSSRTNNKAFHKGGKVMDRLPNRAPKSIRAKSSRRSNMIERF